MPHATCTLSDGTPLSYVDHGQGMPLLLVHGFPLDHSMWQRQLASLAGRYRVLAPDLRGFGSSGVTPGTVTMEQFADDLAELLRLADVRQSVVLAGLSMGGYVALAFWRKYSSQVRAMVLCDTRAAADTPEAAQSRRETADRVEREGPESLAKTMVGRLFSPATAASQPHLIQSTWDLIRRTSPAGIAAAGRGMAERPDSTALLGSITVPALVVVGEDDVIATPDEMSAMAAAMPSARLAKIPQAGHMAPLENPTAVDQALVELLTTLEQ